MEKMQEQQSNVQGVKKGEEGDVPIGEEGDVPIIFLNANALLVFTCIIQR